MILSKAGVEPYIERITESGCWIWLGGLSSNGYGQIDVIIGGKRTTRRAHSIIYELYNGARRFFDSVLDHKCKVHCCVNPDHLEEVTQQENVLRGIGISAKNAVKTHCKNGHEFSKENMYERVDRVGHRECRPCILKRSKDQYQKKLRKKANL